MFDLVEESLDQIALAVEREIARSLDRAIFLRRNYDTGTALRDEFDGGITVVSFVSRHVFCGNSGQQQFGLGAIGNLTFGKNEPQGITQSIAEDMELGRQSAARAANGFRRLIPPFAPALCWCARTMVASIITYSKSGSSAKALKSLSQTPFRGPTKFGYYAGPAILCYQPLGSSMGTGEAKWKASPGYAAS